MIHIKDIVEVSIFETKSAAAFPNYNSAPAVTVMMFDDTGDGSRFFLPKTSNIITV